MSERRVPENTLKGNGKKRTVILEQFENERPGCRVFPAKMAYKYAEEQLGINEQIRIRKNGVKAG